MHQLYEDPAVIDEVAGRFGAGVAPEGTVDRAAVAQAAFASQEDRAWLEGLLWPRVGVRIGEWRAGLERASPPPRAAVVEVPLLFESGMGDAFDATIAVIADEQLRAERAAARGHEAVAERSLRQLSQEEKAQRATYVVVNDGSVADLGAKLSDILAMLPR